MENLFSRHKPARGRVCLMLAGSLVLHGGLVGIASLWTPPPIEDHTVIVDGIPDDPTVDPSPAKNSEPPLLLPPETPEVMATPEVVDPVVPPPPVAEDPVFAEPSEPIPPPHRPTVIKPSTSRPVSTRTTSRTATGPAGNGAFGNGSQASAASAWTMPHPPYPRMIHTPQIVGKTTVHITTDAAGRVSNVVIVQSTGNPLLDNHTTSYVRNNWHGPPNASRTTEFVYEIR